MTTNLINIENQLIELNKERQLKKAEYEKFLKVSSFQIDELLREKGLVMNGLDLEKIKNAESILRVVGLDNDIYNDRCVTEAIKDIASGSNKMAKEYFGVKNYSGWTHQECDCRYGYGPTHGYIVFSVGLNKPNEQLTDEQREDSLYYLNLLKDKTTRMMISKQKVKV